VSGLERLAPLTGVAFVVLIVVSIVLTSQGSPDDFPGEPAQIVEYFEENTDEIFIGSWAGIVGAFFLLWFAGSVRARLRAAEGGDGRLSAVAFGGAVTAAAMGLAIDVTNFAGAVRAEEDGQIETAVATTLYDLQGIFVAAGLPIGIAVFIGATGLVALRTGVLPKWLGIVSVVLVIPLLIPIIAWAVTGLGLLWALVVSILLYVRQPTAPAAGATRVGGGPPPAAASGPPPSGPPAA
jgi:hypothetical protein